MSFSRMFFSSLSSSLISCSYSRMALSSTEISLAVNGSVWSLVQQVGPGMMLPMSEIFGYAATRGREQQLYDHFISLGAKMRNSIKPVWSHNPLGPTYHAASNLASDSLHPYTGAYK